ncbi:MAG: hypothetical protein ACKVHA_09450 [Fidelibacterota bacterium]|jgi:hypothetical protein|tara:strand:- start:268 stop:408 length:141 start_codon:yes stop_codon:yes gene_type:complete
MNYYTQEKADKFNKLYWFEERLAGYNNSTAMVLKDQKISYSKTMKS